MRFIKNLGDLTTPYLNLKSLNRGGVSSVGSDDITPHLIFDYVITSHQFNPTPYFTKQLSDNRIKTQDKVRELHNQGLGYTKIHQYLTKNGYEIGKSRTTVDSMIKKMKNRDELIGWFYFCVIGVRYPVIWVFKISFPEHFTI